MFRPLSDNEIRIMQHDLKEKDFLLNEILAIASNLPPFPDVVWKVMSLLRKAAPPAQIEEVIKYDQAITSRILKMGQSAYYARGRRIRSLKDAVLTLGNDKLVQIILIASASAYFDNRAPGSHANERSVWEHSVSTALMGEKIASRLKHKKGVSPVT